MSLTRLIAAAAYTAAVASLATAVVAEAARRLPSPRAGTSSSLAHHLGRGFTVWQARPAAEGGTRVSTWSNEAGDGSASYRESGPRFARRHQGGVRRERW